MRKKEKRRRPSLDKDKENRKLRRKILRLEDKLDRQKEERRKRSLSRSTSRCSPSRYSSGYSLHREWSASRFSPRSSAARSVLSYSSVRRSRSRDGQDLDLDQDTRHLVSERY